MGILRSKLCITSITNGEVACANPVITVNKQLVPDGVTVNCELDANKCFQVSVLADDVTGLAGLCIPVTIECEDCGKCDPIFETLCFCNDNGDCADCENCVNGICNNRCADGQICVDDVCQDCGVDDDCPDGQICVGGNCQCPPDRPFEDEFGNCNECQTDANCPDCTTCVDGSCVPIICSTGACDPETNDCVECMNSGDCDGANECCVNKECECCDGYVRDILTGNCIEAPECILDGDCGPCFICDGGVCVRGPEECFCDCNAPNCDDDSACVPHPNNVDCYCKNCAEIGCTDDCVDGCECEGDDCVPSPCFGNCDDFTDCGDGCGCYDGQCISCEELSCMTSECSNASGCGCLDNNCVDTSDDCSPAALELEWLSTTTGTPGDNEPALGLSSFVGTPGDLVSSDSDGISSIYRDWTFNVAAANSNGLGSGTWYVSPYEGLLHSVGTGSTCTFSLSSLQDITFGFYLIYKEDNPCYRSIKIPVILNQSIENPLQSDDPTAWKHLPSQIINSGGCSGGGTLSTTWQLCVKNSTSFTFDNTTASNVVNDGLNATFSGTGSCLTVNWTGCGTWQGDFSLSCDGVTTTATAPEFEVDALCCDPYDPSCSGPSGGTCDAITTVDMPINVFNYFGGGIPKDGAEAVAMIDIESGAISFADLFALSGTICWSTTTNDGSNDIVAGVQAGDGFSSPLYYQFTYKTGGCVQVGYSCDMTIGCNKYQGQACVAACDDFDFYFIPNSNSPTETTYWLIPSNLSLNAGGFPWTLTSKNSSGGILGTFDVTPTGTLNNGSTVAAPYFNDVSYATGYMLQLSVNRTYVRELDAAADNPCTGGRGSIDLDTYGCTEPLACNYDPDAIIDDGSCSNVETTVVYNTACTDTSGLVVTPSGGTAPYTITVDSGSGPVAYSAGMFLQDATHTISTTDVNGCNKTESLATTCCLDGGLAITAVNLNCDTGGGDTEITVTFSGGLASWTMELTDVNGLLVADEGLSQVVGVAGTVTWTFTGGITTEEDFNITLTDGQGCIKTSSINTAGCCSDSCVTAATLDAQPLTAALGNVVASTTAAAGIYTYTITYSGDATSDTFAALINADMDAGYDIVQLSISSGAGVSFLAFVGAGINSITTMAVAGVSSTLTIEYDTSAAYDTECCEAHILSELGLPSVPLVTMLTIPSTTSDGTISKSFNFTKTCC